MLWWWLASMTTTLLTLTMIIMIVMITCDLQVSWSEASHGWRYWLGWNSVRVWSRVISHTWDQGALQWLGSGHWPLRRIRRRGEAEVGIMGINMSLITMSQVGVGGASASRIVRVRGCSDRDCGLHCHVVCGQCAEVWCHPQLRTSVSIRWSTVSMISVTLLCVRYTWRSGERGHSSLVSAWLSCGGSVRSRWWACRLPQVRTIINYF